MDSGSKMNQPGCHGKMKVFVAEITWGGSNLLGFCKFPTSPDRDCVSGPGQRQPWGTLCLSGKHLGSYQLSVRIAQMVTWTPLRLALRFGPWINPRSDPRIAVGIDNVWILSSFRDESYGLCFSYIAYLCIFFVWETAKHMRKVCIYIYILVEDMYCVYRYVL